MTSAKTEQYTGWLQKAESYAANGAFAKAIDCTRQALTLEPRSFRSWIALGRYQYHAGRYSEAVKSTNQAEQFDPLLPDFQNVQRAIQSRDFTKAEHVSAGMLKKEPGHPRAVFALAEIYAARGDVDNRIETLKQGLNSSPANLILRHMLMGTYEDNADIEKAINTSRHMTEIQEAFSSYWIHMGICLRYGLNDEALATADKAEAFCSGNPEQQSEVDLIRGQVYKIQGQREKAIRALRACIAHKPQNATAWSALADMKNFVFSKEDQAALSKIVDAPSGDPVQKSMAAFALAKAFEMDGALDKAMPVYKKANALLPNIRFNGPGFTAAVDKQIESFDRATLETQAPLDEGARPIFILGLPRSGSTLVEQILASHSQIEGTIELPILPRIKRKIHGYCAKSFQQTYLSSLGKLTQEHLGEFGQDYIQKTALFRAEDKAFFTDKLPVNFENVGLIHKILPQAIIIDTRRNPMDCGLSMFKQYFASGSHFSYNLSHIGVYYNGYLKLMDHWDHILPGKVFRVQYEDMIADPDAMVRALLTHIGLGFEPGCLKFYENKRPVRTASSEQVRQPINRKGIGVWRQIETELEPLKKALGADTLARFKNELAL